MFKRKVDHIMMTTKDYPIVRGFDKLFETYGKRNNWDKIIFDPEINEWVVYYSIMYRTRIGRWFTHDMIKRFVLDVANGGSE